MTNSEKKKIKAEIELLWWGGRRKAEHLLFCCGAIPIALEAAVSSAFAGLCASVSALP